MQGNQRILTALPEQHREPVTRMPGVERTTRDTFPARTMNPQGCHPSGRIQSAAPVTVIQNEPKPQSRDTHGDAGINRASGTKTRGTDFRLLLPQLEGRQWGDHEPIGAPSDSAKMLIPPLHPVSTDGTADLRPQPASYSLSGTRRVRGLVVSSVSPNRLPPRSSLTSDDILCGPPGDGGSSTPSSRCRGRRGAWRSTDSRT
ncbi:hypothetical protein JZ751_013746 [Albula glossodonta]|uniref:Uncharacterized protein n=1 Tax=Albula glossodonta TaxID=121402 RepID=A0A8T2NVN5_9TELE|nr:hypothetical protein JZ751_013746 [Albula glossodonta]